MHMLQLQQGRTRISITPEAGGRIAQMEILDGSDWLPLLHDGAALLPNERNPLGWGSFVMAP